MARGAHSLNHARRICRSANRSGSAHIHRAVRLWSTIEIMTFDRPGEAAPFRFADYVDDVSIRKLIDQNLVANARAVIGRVQAKLFQHSHGRNSASGFLKVPAHRLVNIHQRIDCLRRRIENIHQALMRSDLKLLARFLIDVRRAQDGPLVLDRRQWNRPGHAGAGALRCFDNLCRRLIEDSVIVGFEPDSDFFVQHRSNRSYRSYSTTSLTVPAPTVRPPSRMANRNPFSIAIGAINSISIATLSPGITISTPVGRCATPVTSVVRK